jgi:hypothetical protein
MTTAAAAVSLTSSVTSAQNWYLIGLTAGSLVVCFTFSLVRAGTLGLLPIKGGKQRAGQNTAQQMTLGSRMGQGQWDFSQSFATNIAVIGSVLTLILNTNAVAPGTLTSDILPSGAYGGLGVFFGTLVIVAPLLYNGTARKVSVSSPAARDTAAEYHGTVSGFLLASMVTEWGLLGSVATVFMTLLELEHAGSLSVTPVVLLAITLIAAMYCFARYSWVKVGGTIRDQFDPAAAVAAVAAQARDMAARSPQAAVAAEDQGQSLLPPPRPRWTLL